MRMRRRSKRKVQEDNKDESILVDDQKVAVAAAAAVAVAVATADVADLDGFFVACDGLFGLEHVLVRVPHVANTTHTHTHRTDENVRDKIEALFVSIFYKTQVQVQIY